MPQRVQCQREPGHRQGGVDRRPPIDARRLGHGPYLPEPFLQRAAPGYLDDNAWDQIGGQDWFTGAVDRLTARHRRLPGPLIEHQPRPGEPSFPQSLYRLADYLDQHGRRERVLLCPPAAFWDAATCHAHTPAALAALAEAAWNRCRYRHATRLVQRAADIADAGDGDVLRMLARLLREAGDRDGAECVGTWWEAGDRDGAERLVRFGLTADGEIEAPWSQ
ncbi:hypothetical protein Misp01_66470 [Microtetraspora sp. NBRC 13810]|uniref:hypothetical protein n=1 Tax=Microtetraspora sp. NBRC 13810 TaxID=3030990 RepID=UPI0024A4637E|nr:hypothetical protein [Microtetraspora sp. NBRC 13810]GLW11519.1 hypothetical protein Misp01_66470 [Microtetraspora sp. NBRC 13810]